MMKEKRRGMSALFRHTFLTVFVLIQSGMSHPRVSSELDSIINVLGLSPEDPLDTFIGK